MAELRDYWWFGHTHVPAKPPPAQVAAWYAARCPTCGKVPYDEARAKEVAELISARERMYTYYSARCGS